MSTSKQPPPTPAEEGTFKIGEKLGHSNQFTITRLLGRGGFGEVYLAREERAHRDVAIKVMLPEHNRNRKFLARFKGEYVFGSMLSHPNLVQMYDASETAQGVHYIVMEYAEGEGLWSRMARAEQAQGQLGVEAAQHIGWQVSSVLAQLHERNIVHRDLKPGNIQVVKDPTIPGGDRYKLLDFGVAKLTNKDRAKSLQVDFDTTHGMVMGTVTTMDPTSEEGQGPESDVYSLGCILYRCIAGNYPFAGKDFKEVLKEHAQREPIPLQVEDPSTPPDFAALVHRMLAKKKADRPSMAEVCTFFALRLGLAGSQAAQIVVRGGTLQLQAVLADLSTGAANATESNSFPVVSIEGQSAQVGQQHTASQTKNARRRRQVVVGAGLGVVALLAMIVFVVHSVGAPSTHPAAVTESLKSTPAMRPAQDTPDLGIAVASPTNKPATTAPASIDEKPLPLEKKRKKKKNGLGQ